MKVSLIEKKNSKLLFAVELSEKELAALKEDPAAGLVGELNTAYEFAVRQEAASEEPKKEEKPLPREPFIAKHYKGIRIGKTGSQSEMEERLLDYIIENNDIVLSEETVESEVEYTLTGFFQSMKYQNMFGGNRFDPSSIDVEAQKEEIRRDVIRELKTDMILKSIIEQEHIQATAEDLEAAAVEIAGKQETSIETVKDFFGEDLLGLAGDVCRKKALRFLCENAQAEE